MIPNTTTLEAIDNFILMFLATILGGIFLYIVKGVWDESLIKIKYIRKDDKLGFEVNVRKGFLKNVKPRCNEHFYSWENTDGSEEDNKSLYVGDTPSVFFPFQINQVESNKNPQHENPAELFNQIFIVLKDRKTNKKIYACEITTVSHPISTLYKIDSECADISVGEIIPDSNGYKIKSVETTRLSEIHLKTGIYERGGSFNAKVQLISEGITKEQCFYFDIKGSKLVKDFDGKRDIFTITKNHPLYSAIKEGKVTTGNIPLRLSTKEIHSEKRRGK